MYFILCLFKFRIISCYRFSSKYEKVARTFRNDGTFVFKNFCHCEFFRIIHPHDRPGCWRIVNFYRDIIYRWTVKQGKKASFCTFLLQSRRFPQQFRLHHFTHKAWVNSRYCFQVLPNVSIRGECLPRPLLFKKSLANRSWWDLNSVVRVRIQIL